MRRGVALLALCAAACDGPPMPGEGCPVVDQMICGQASGGTGAALVCAPRAAGPPQWESVSNCGTCDHVTGCKTELICNGTNIANEGLHCDVVGVGACSVSNNAKLLKCESNNTWTLSFDCSAQGKVCGLTGAGTISCK